MYWVCGLCKCIEKLIFFEKWTCSTLHHTALQGQCSFCWWKIFIIGILTKTRRWLNKNESTRTKTKTMRVGILKPEENVCETRHPIRAHFTRGRKWRFRERWEELRRKPNQSNVVRKWGRTPTQMIGWSGPDEHETKGQHPGGGRGRWTFGHTFDLIWKKM